MKTKKKFLGLYALAGILILLIVPELGLRIFFPQVQPQDSDSRLILFNKYHGSAALIPNKSGRFFGKMVHTDSVYAIRRNKHMRKAVGKWIFLGDSVPMGVGVDDDSVFSVHMQPYSDLDILNYSVIGYSARDYRNFCRSLEKEASLRDCVVRLSVFWTLNDVYSLPLDHEPDWLEKIRSFIRSRYRTYILLKGLISNRALAHYKYDSSYYKEKNEELRKSMVNLCMVKHACDSLQIKMDLVLLPYRQQLINQSFREQELVERWFLHLCGDNDVNVIQAQGAFNSHAPGSYYLFGDGIHFSCMGHRELADFLRKEFLLH